MRICDDDRLTRGYMFVNEHVLIAAFHRPKHFFAFKHESQNVAGIFTGRIILADQTSQETFSVVLGEGLWSRSGGRLVFGTPK